MALDLFSGTTVKVETTLAPPFTLDLSTSASGPPSPLVSFLRPRVTVVRDGTTLLVSQPAGSPDDAPPFGFLFIALLLGALIWASSNR